jgi:hypothetical protein
MGSRGMHLPKLLIVSYRHLLGILVPITMCRQNIALHTCPEWDLNLLFKHKKTVHAFCYATTVISEFLLQNFSNDWIQVGDF